MTAGIVSARGRDIGEGPYDDFIQIDAPVNVGNSGGPTFNVKGEVIGVNTAIFSPSGGSVGVAFDIPADTVKFVVQQIKEKGQVTRGWIGVQIQTLSPAIADALALKSTDGALGRAGRAQQSGRQGRRRDRRCHQYRQRGSGKGFARTGAADRRHGARHGDEIRRLARRTREDSHGDAGQASANLGGSQRRGAKAARGAGAWPDACAGECARGRRRLRAW